MGVLQNDTKDYSINVFQALLATYRMTMRSVFFVSDRTAITAEVLGNSLLTQFPQVSFQRHTLRFVDSREKAGQVAQLLAAALRETGVPPLVFSTLIDAELRNIVAAAGCVLFDLVDTFMRPLEGALAQPGSRAIGEAHSVRGAVDYGARIAAIDYALSCDDGLGEKGYDKADLIIVGVSRCGKTPVALYLALMFGVYVANVPLTAELLDRDALLPALARRRQKLFGLTIAPARLHAVRTERRRGSVYASLQQCQEELRRAESLYRQERIPYLETTAMSIEEIATSIMDRAGIQRRLS